MASIIIRNAKVERFIGRKGFSCSTSYTTKDGSEKKEYFTVWSDDLNHISEGQHIDIRGLISARIEEWEDKQSGELRRKAAIHVNQPKITPPKSEDYAGYDEGRAVQAQLTDVWPEAKPITEEAPF